MNQERVQYVTVLRIFINILVYISPQNIYILGMSTVNRYKKRKQWSSEDMSAAVTAVREKKMGYLKAARYFNIPRTTLFRLVNDKETPIDHVLFKFIK